MNDKMKMIKLYSKECHVHRCNDSEINDILKSYFDGIIKYDIQLFKYEIKSTKRRYNLVDLKITYYSIETIKEMISDLNG